MLSVAIPLAFIAFIAATVAPGSAPLGINLRESVGAIVALAVVIGVSVAAMRG